jgi:ABC-2 type transport system ATP-binding protein
LNVLDQPLNDARKVPENQPGLRNVMNRVDAEITVQVDGLRREFDSKEGKVVALDGVNLQVRKGEIFGVLGPNGAGKTTMIRILSTLLLPSAGKAGVMGFDVEKEPEKIRAVINMASGAERAGYDFISARGNLWFFSQLYGIPTEEAHRRINELSDMLGLQSYLDRKFYALSTGYKQRVTLVRAFINDPKVVFLDEPTIGLDVMTALSIREYILKQAKEHGRTILLATHNMAEVDAICNRVAIIDKGKILACDTPAALKRSLGAPSLVLEISPIPTPGSLEQIGKLEGVKGFTSSVDEERGLSRIQVVVDGDRTAQSVIDSLRESGLTIVSNWRQQATLEEVFVALVGRGFREREHEAA